MAATSPNEENGPRMNVDQSVSGAADDNGHYLENSSAVVCPVKAGVFSRR